MNREEKKNMEAMRTSAQAFIEAAYNAFIRDGEEEQPKPCPFCGSRDYISGVKDRLGSWYVSCVTCDARGPLGKDKKGATKAWNKRA